MSLWRQLRGGLRVLTKRAASDRDLSEEMEHYRELAAAEHMARGLSAEEAARTALLEVGSADAVREQVRSQGWESVVEGVLADVRYAGRRLRRDAAFAVVCVLTLGLGVGASTAVFSAVNPILFEALPYPHAERVVWVSALAGEGIRVPVAYGIFREVQERSRSFEQLAVADVWQPALTGVVEPERLSGDRVSAGYFRALGVAPALGRDFEASDARVNAPAVAIVSDGLARRRFGGARRILGQHIALEGDPYTVIGVMPAGFDNVLAPASEVWSPLRYRSNAPFESAEWGNHLRMVGRLKAGVSAEQARRELARIARARLPEFPRPPWAELKQGLALESLQSAVTSGVRPALLAIMGAVLLLLVVVCVNVTNLLLTRGAQRRSELAMRATLGAGRGRLVRQLLTESLLLAACGGALGVLLSVLGVHALVALAPAGLPRADAIRLNGGALVFALALTTIVGLAVGLAPALFGARGELRAASGSGARATGHHGLRRGLVVTEVALALVLLVGAGLMLRTLQRLLATAPGFDPGHVLTLQVEAAGHQYGPDAARLAFFQATLEAVRHVPGVVDAAFSSQLPLSGDDDAYGMAFESMRRANPNDLANAVPVMRYVVTPAWFATMRIPLRLGRLLDEHDRPGMPQAILISASLARRVFPRQDPIGQRVRIGPALGNPAMPSGVVVGVVPDVKQMSLALGSEDAFYAALGQWGWVDNVESLAVRTTGDPSALVPAIKRAIWSVDPNQPILRVATMVGLVAASEARRHFVLVVFEAFALAALLLAALGIYGVLAGSVAERTRELGVRAALGAAPRDIVLLVLGEGGALTGAGVVLGLAGAALATRAIASLLFGLSRLDPPTYLAVIALLAAVAGIACSLPAWGAARVDPVTALRAE